MLQAAGWGYAELLRNPINANFGESPFWDVE